MATGKNFLSDDAAKRTGKAVRWVEGQIPSKRAPSLGPPRDRGGQGGGGGGMEAIVISGNESNPGWYTARTVAFGEGQTAEDVIGEYRWESFGGHDLDVSGFPLEFPAGDTGARHTDGRRILFFYGIQTQCGAPAPS